MIKRSIKSTDIEIDISKSDDKEVILSVESFTDEFRIRQAYEGRFVATIGDKISVNPRTDRLTTVLIKQYMEEGGFQELRDHLLKCTSSYLKAIKCSSIRADVFGLDVLVASQKMDALSRSFYGFMRLIDRETGDTATVHWEKELGDDQFLYLEYAHLTDPDLFSRLCGCHTDKLCVMADASSLCLQMVGAYEQCDGSCRRRINVSRTPGYKGGNPWSQDIR